jgi:hypothetical protein
MERFRVGEQWAFNIIEELVHFANSDEEKFILTEFGENYVGENFIVIKNEEDQKSVSFVLWSVQGHKYMYKCIYSDYQKEKEG